MSHGKRPKPTSDYESAKQTCAVRSAIRRRAEPGRLYWKNNSVSLDDRRDLRAKGVLSHGCALGPRAKLVFVDEARKTLRFELAPSMAGDYFNRVERAAGIGGWFE